MAEALENLHRRGAEGAEFAQREVTEIVIAAAMEVHSILGPGLLESVYQRALEHELSLRRVPFASQTTVPVVYKGETLDCALRLDLLVHDRVIAEVKAVASLDEVHRAQLPTYLRLANREVGLLLNFNCVVLEQGIKRVANTLRTSAFSAPLR